MKRISLLLVALLFSISFYGQAWDNSKPDNRLTFGVRAGTLYSTCNLTSDGGLAFDVVSKNSVKMKWGFNAGLIVDYSIVKSFALEVGAMYSNKGFGLDPGYYIEDGWDVKLSDNYSLSYMEIPISSLFRFLLSNDTYLLFKVGCYVDFMLSGTTEFEHTYLDGSYRDAVNFDNKSDAGALLGIGVNYKKMHFEIQYEHGVLDIINKFHYCCKKRSVGFMIGYDF